MCAFFSHILSYMEHYNISIELFTLKPTYNSLLIFINYHNLNTVNKAHFINEYLMNCVLKVIPTSINPNKAPNLVTIYFQILTFFTTILFPKYQHSNHFFHNMATRINAIAIVLMLASILLAALVSCSPCDDEISRLTPCYSYIEGSSKPASDCCSHLSEVAEAKPECLCRVMHSDNNLNRSRAIGLPKACNVTTPPANLCNSSKNTNEKHLYFVLQFTEKHVLI